MNVNSFMTQLCEQRFENAFNPYADCCPIHDLPDAPSIRKAAICAMLKAAEGTGIDSLWIGRDLGYRGGRRTGLAFTDDTHIDAHAARWGVHLQRPTKGAAVRERTAAVIWSALMQITAPIFLWNVFPFHPHTETDPFTNRSHNAIEREFGEEILLNLIVLLQPREIVAVGNDAATTASRLAGSLRIAQVRHPSYGGQTTFLKQIQVLYRLPARHERSTSQIRQ